MRARNKKIHAADCVKMVFKTIENGGKYLGIYSIIYIDNKKAELTANILVVIYATFKERCVYLQ